MLCIDLPIQTLKENKTFSGVYIAKCFIDSLLTEKFPSCMKLANITPVFKKGSRALKITTDQWAYCRYFKILENTIYKQLWRFLIMCYQSIMWFPKRFSTQTCLLMLLEFWRQSNPNLRPTQNFWLFKSRPFDSKASCLRSWPISFETTWLGKHFSWGTSGRYAGSFIV